jgi:hypothetical protein
MANLWNLGEDRSAEELSFDDAYDAGSNMKLRLQQGLPAPAAKSITAGQRGSHQFHQFHQPVGEHFNSWDMELIPNAPPQKIDAFAAARQYAAPRRRTCNEIFRNIHAPPREQFRGSPYKTMARPHSEQFEPRERDMGEQQAMEYEMSMDGLYMGQPYMGQPYMGQPYMDQFTALRRQGDANFRNTPRERFRGGHSYASRGGPNGGARAYGGLQNLQNDSSMYPDAPDLAPSVQDMFTVIHPSLKQAGQQPRAFKGPTALRRLM